MQPGTPRRISRRGCLLAILSIVLLLGALGSVVGVSLAQESGCASFPPISTASAAPVAGQMTVPLPGDPFGAVASPDGRWVFVSVTPSGSSSGSNTANGVAVLRRIGDQVSLVGVLPLRGSPAGLALTADGSLLLVANGDGVAFVDAQRAVSDPSTAVLGYIHDGDNPGTIEVTLSPDERYAFATDENAGTVSVLDVQQARSVGVDARDLLGQVPVDLGPVGIALSPDGHALYVTSEAHRPAIGWTALPVIAASALGLIKPTGTLTVLDVAQAERAPAQTQRVVLARVAAGCAPVRVAVSPDGETVWVTARASNMLLAFSAPQLQADPAHALLATVRTGPLPVGVVLVAAGRIAVVANSNRVVGGQSPQTLSLVDTAAALAGRPAILGAVRVGAFPRDLALTPDGRLLLVANASSASLTLIDVAALPAG
jgi:DNA-binding beta-propeller fold protein YncE